LRLFKKKNEDSRSRRSSRLLMLRMRECGMIAGVIAVVGAMGFAGYQSGSFKKIGGWASSRTLTATANAGFKVKDILVTGRVQIPAEELMAHLSIKEGMPVFGISIADAQKSLTEMSWVQSAFISRRLPDKIIIELKERTPAALWQFQQKISLIDQEGIVLAADNLDNWQHLPLVVGADAPKHVMELVNLLAAEPVIAADFASATRVGSRRWDLRLKNGVAVKLPEQDMELALRRLALMEEQKNILGRNITGIDLRQPDKMVVTPVASNDETTPVKKNKKTSI
jgi:cell division protein FtsQ